MEKKSKYDEMEASMVASMLAQREATELLRRVADLVAKSAAALTKNVGPAVKSLNRDIAAVAGSTVQFENPDGISSAEWAACTDPDGFVSLLASVAKEKSVIARAKALARVVSRLEKSRGSAAEKLEKLDERLSYCRKAKEFGAEYQASCGLRRKMETAVATIDRRIEKVSDMFYETRLSILKFVDEATAAVENLVTDRDILKRSLLKFNDEGVLVTIENRSSGTRKKGK